MLTIGSVVINCEDFPGTILFWERALRYESHRLDTDFAILKDPDGGTPNVSVQMTDELKFGRNRMHLDLYADDQNAEVERLLQLGATLHRSPEPGEDFVILADPEGKLFCVVAIDETRSWAPRTGPSRE